MKTVESSVFGHKVVIAVPETVEQYDQMANKAGTCLEDAIDHEIAHGTLGDFRKQAIPLIEEATGIKRREVGTGTFEEKDGKKVEITRPEKEMEYYRRVCGEKGLNPEQEPFANIFARLSAGGDKEIKFDPKVRERKAPEPKTLSQDYKTAAKNTLSKYDDNKINKNIRKYIPDAAEFVRTGDEAKDVETLGWLLKAYEKAKRLAGDM